MFRMAVGHSDDIDPEAAVDAVVAQCNRALAGERPRAGLLFLTYDTDPAPLIAGVRKAYPDAEIIGTTSVGEMSSVLGFQEDSVTLALFASDTVDITAGLATDVSSDPAGAAQRAIAEARGKTGKEPRLCLAFPSVALLIEPSVLLRELRRHLGEDVPVLGGGSGPRAVGDVLQARQFYAGESHQDAVAVLLFSGPLSFSFGIDNGWRPVGRTGTVTDASLSTIRTIDHEPALAFYEHYLGPGATPTAANPLAVFEDDSEDFYLRVPLLADSATGAIDVAGDASLGARVRLTIAVTDEIFDGTRSAVRTAVENYPKHDRPAAALVFSCAIRKLMLGTRTGMELDITREELGADLPISGLYCYGEIGPGRSGSTRFHNETIVAVLLGEST
jgi:hypothetical protein